jgi:hypothetical protein
MNSDPGPCRGGKAFADVFLLLEASILLFEAFGFSRVDIFSVHQALCFARHTVPLQLDDEKSGINCVRCFNKQFDPVLLVLRYKRHLFSQHFVHNLPPISHSQVVAEQYVLRNTNSGVL